MRAHLFALALLLLCLPAPARACSCVPPGPVEEERARATRVFAGEVVAVEDRARPMFVQWLQGRWDALLRGLGANPPPRDAWGYRVRFEVAETFKGRASRRVDVATGYGGGDCGYGFEVGRRYVVFAHGPDDALGVGICSLTGPVETFRGLEALRRAVD